MERENSGTIAPQPKGLRRQCWIIFLVTLAAYLLPIPAGPGHFLLTKSRAESWNDQARIATVESLTERGTLAIDRSKWGWFTGDKVFLRDHFYATKPPLLSAVGAVSYWVLRGAVALVTGQQISYMKNEDIIYPWVTFTTCGLAFAILLVYFFRALYLIEIPQTARWWLFWALAIGSLYPAYSTIFNNHTVAGSAMFVAFFYILKYRLGGPLKPWEAIFAGLMAGFAGVNDYTGALPFVVLLYILLTWHDLGSIGSWKLGKAQSGAAAIGVIFFATAALSFLMLGSRGIGVLLLGLVSLCAVAAIVAAIHRKPASLLFFVGVLLPVTAHLFLNSHITGNLMPTYIQSDVYIAAPPGYFGEVVSPDEASLMFWARWKYIGTALFGIRGVFLYTPILLMGLVISAMAMFKKGGALRWEAAAVVITVLVGWGYVLAFLSPNFGGTSFGFRYSLPAVPLLIYFCYPIFTWKSSAVWSMLFRNAVWWGTFVAIVAIPFPWGIFGELPATQNSIVGNLQYIAINMIYNFTG